MEFREIDYITIGWDSHKYTKYMDQFYQKSFPKALKRDCLMQSLHKIYYDKDLIIDNLKFALRSQEISDPLPPIQFISHHRSHAASAFYPSPFEKALILMIDGSGEENTTVIWKGKGEQIESLMEFNLPHSLGCFYSSLTEFIGFSAYTGEGKLMDLAAYGKDNLYYREKLMNILKIGANGYELDPSFIYFGSHEYRYRFTDQLFNHLKLLPRLPESIIKQEYCDLAFETQRLLEKVVISLVKKYSQETRIKKICLAGGVAMNCKMNGAILHESEIEDIYIFPVPYDAGTALGSALILSQELGFSPRKIRINHHYWGPEYDCNTIKNVLNSMKLNYVQSSDIVSDVVRELTSDQFVSWFQGQAEIGARALGARSILANPSSLKIKNRLNQEVKKRKVFRPFAPSFLK